jgi:drug/metabolite transporter (DMT)-like permease
MPTASTPAPDQHRLAIAALLVSAVLWSTGGLLIKSIDWHPMAITAVRGMIAATAIGLVWNRRLRLDRTPLLMAGALAYAGTAILFVISTRLTTAANAILLQYTAPVHVALFAPHFLGERTGRRDVARVAMVGVGMVLFFLDRLTPAGMLGNLAAIGSGFCFGWLTLILRRHPRHAGVETLFLGSVITAAAGAPFLRAPWPSGREWALLGILGVVQMTVPYLIYTWAVRRVRAVEAILLSVVEPLLNPVWVLLAVGERPGPWALVGGAVILVSLVAGHLPRSLAAPQLPG